MAAMNWQIVSLVFALISLCASCVAVYYVNKAVREINEVVRLCYEAARNCRICADHLTATRHGIAPELEETAGLVNVQGYDPPHRLN